jgi:hypothetical protein
MIIRNLFFESGSTEAKKNKKKYCKGISFITYLPNLISCGFLIFL